jgi:pimeloyl-ACP methyl ester carboxylesterase
VNVRKYGDGPRHFLCLHGWSGNHATFERLADPGLTLWCPDLPATNAYHITNSLAEVVREMPGPVEIVGNCSGAIYGLLLAQRVPTRRIILIDAFAFWPSYFRLFLIPVFGRKAYNAAFASPVGRRIANAALANRRTADTDLTDGFSRVDHDATYKHLQILSTVSSASQFAGIEADVEILYGEKSFSAVRKSVAIWNGIFPQARRYCLAGAGHLPILEATQQLSSILMLEGASGR